MTGGAAAALGLADRGLLAEGQAADVVLFDPATIIDRSTTTTRTSIRRASAR
jgi:N-acyl-D-amino-acid deacylase